MCISLEVLFHSGGLPEESIGKNLRVFDYPHPRIGHANSQCWAVNWESRVVASPESRDSRVQGGLTSLTPLAIRTMQCASHPSSPREASPWVQKVRHIPALVLTPPTSSSSTWCCPSSTWYLLAKCLALALQMLANCQALFKQVPNTFHAVYKLYEVYHWILVLPSSFLPIMVIEWYKKRRHSGI